MTTRAPVQVGFLPGDVVHVMRFAVSLCGRPPGLYHTWPAGHFWVRAEDFGSIPTVHRCPRCMVKNK